MIIATLLLLILTYLFLSTSMVKKQWISLDIKLKETIKYIHISDIHNKLEFINGNVIKIINVDSPDFLLLTGDLANNQRQLPNVLEKLSRINCKVYIVLGNYEREEVKFLKKKRVALDILVNEISRYDNLVLLINESKEIRVKDLSISIYGFDNSIYGNEAFNQHSTDLAFDYKIILAHSPNIIKFIRNNDIEFNHLLVGHTHGKQINLSINKTKYDDYHTGTKEFNQKTFFSINKGLGTAKLPIRYKSKPTIDIYKIV